MMVGRGRGRGRGALNFDAITKTVGTTAPQIDTWRQFHKDGPLSELALMISALDINATSFNAVIQCASHALTADSSEKSMEQVLKLLVDRCNRDWLFAHQAAVICRDLVTQEEIGKRFRAQLLRVMQTHFKEKDDLRQESVTKFVGSMSFLCQTLAVLRADSGAPFVPLVTPVVEVIALMLNNNASDLEMECGVHQVRAIMATVYMCDPSMVEEYHRLIVTIRLHILDSRGTRELREKMLEAIEENASLSSSSKQC